MNVATAVPLTDRAIIAERQPHPRVNWFLLLFEIPFLLVLLAVAVGWVCLLGYGIFMLFS